MPDKRGTDNRGSTVHSLVKLPNRERERKQDIPRQTETHIAAV